MDKVTEFLKKKWMWILFGLFSVLAFWGSLTSGNFFRVTDSIMFFVAILIIIFFDDDWESDRFMNKWSLEIRGALIWGGSLISKLGADHGSTVGLILLGAVWALTEVLKHKKKLSLFIKNLRYKAKIFSLMRKAKK